jgi:hypothetical protein
LETSLRMGFWKMTDLISMPYFLATRGTLLFKEPKQKRTARRTRLKKRWNRDMYIIFHRRDNSYKWVYIEGRLYMTMMGCMKMLSGY